MAEKNETFMKIASDRYSYSEYQKDGAETNKEAFQRAKRALPEVLKLLPGKQRTYIYLYFIEEKSTVEIAKLHKVNKSTVSRTINRGLNRIYKIMVIISPEFANGLVRKKKYLCNRHKKNSYRKVEKKEKCQD